MISVFAQLQRPGSILQGVWLLLLLTGCGDDPRLVPAAAGEPGTVQLQVAGQTVTVELALDGPTRTQGLMQRTSLGPDRGMLFIFPDTAPRVFWMRNTLIPLDIVFLDDGGEVINIAVRAPPAVEKPGFHSNRPARFVLELNGGWADEHGLAPGQIIPISQELVGRGMP